MYLGECVIIQKEQKHEITRKIHLFIRVERLNILVAAEDNRVALEDILH